MKTFKEFYLRGNGVNLKEFELNIASFVSGDWKLKSNNPSDDDFIVFSYIGQEVERANVYLYLKDCDGVGYKISNIVPSEKSKLDFDEYNAILDKCVQDCILPCAEKYNLESEITSENVSLENYMSEESKKKLHAFSVMANKSTGSSHPDDQRRWHDFICQTVISGDKNVTSILRRWLVEEGWDDENATELTIEYEQGLALLEHYRNRYEQKI
ncbi:hypothetical protein [Lacrimispora sp.]|uniref:hypothetical protein n=1 Tax=Lacrimispora sp. TaxID=2719234 RepID=UPI00399593F3